MKILIIGASGTIGKAVAETFSKRGHEIITAARNSGDIRVDISSVSQIEKMFQQTKDLDAVICTAGTGYYGDFHKMTEENMYVGIKGKLMGQVNVVLIGQHHLKDNGSFTLISGILSEDPVKDSVNVAVVNGALNSFVLAAALEMKNGRRINVISPNLLEESVERYGASFPGVDAVPLQKVTNAFIRSVEGNNNGRIFKVY